MTTKRVQRLQRIQAAQGALKAVAEWRFGRHEHLRAEHEQKCERMATGVESLHGLSSVLGRLAQRRIATLERIESQLGIECQQLLVERHEASRNLESCTRIADKAARAASREQEDQQRAEIIDRLVR